MAIVRAFFDVHHLSTRPVLAGNDVWLYENNAGNPVWNSGIDESIYTDFNTGINGENTVARQAIANTNNSPFPYYNTRSLTINGASSKMYLGNNPNRAAWTYVDNDGGVIDPSAYVLDPSGKAGFNFYIKARYGSLSFTFIDFVIGGMFCTSEGKPKNVNINGIDYCGFGLRFAELGFHFSFVESLPYGSSGSNTGTGFGRYSINNVRNLQLTKGVSVTKEHQLQISKSMNQYGCLENGNFLLGSDGLLHTDWHSAIINNFSMPAFFGHGKYFDELRTDRYIDDIGYDLF